MVLKSGRGRQRLRWPLSRAFATAVGLPDGAGSRHLGLRPPVGSCGRFRDFPTGTDCNVESWWLSSVTIHRQSQS